MENRRSAWTWALAGLAGLAGFAALHLWAPDPSPARAFCLSRRFLGLPCPGCGLTRAFAHLAKGEWSSAMNDHPLAPVLAVEAVAVWIAWGVLILRRSDFRQYWEGWEGWIARAAVVHIAALCVIWIGRLATGTLPW